MAVRKNQTISLPPDAYLALRYLAQTAPRRGNKSRAVTALLRAEMERRFGRAWEHQVRELVEEQKQEATR